MNKRTFTQTTWIQISNPQAPIKLRLFCFPYAGGGARIFHNWSAQLPPEIQVCAIKLPGREQRLHETAYSQIEPLVQALASELRPYFDRPFAFFGHSMGSLISFELARYLRQTGLPEPEQLFVSAHRAPHIKRREPDVHALPDHELIARLRDLSGTPEEILQHAELMQLFLPLLRADFTLCETYHFTEQERFTYPITAFGGTEDTQIPITDLEAWQHHTSGNFQLHIYPGHHFFLHQEQSKLLQVIRQQVQN
ncbi:MAG TPA: thioesterase domain-containing protein [Ktedonobacteraceae bacterium]|nr:thioesterase domain-containing protein [Ktedonobacteraceae bacterium]